MQCDANADGDQKKSELSLGPPHSTLAPVLGHAQTAEGGQARNVSLAASIGAALAGNAAGPCAWLLSCLIDGYV